MKSVFEPHIIEKFWSEEWEKKGYFSPKGNGEPFSILIPPPNVTGSLHMGHALQYAIMDTLVRYKRMQGHNTLWQVGTDHAGIATQMVVERDLAQQGQPNRLQMGRENFIEKVWEWKEESGNTITQQMRRLGNSVDWETERFTLDKQFSGSVTEAFIRLFNEGLIYRGKRLVNWDPKLHTAISDLEVENREKKGNTWHIRYPLSSGAVSQDGNNFILIATTRPETLLGDSAVAVNPKDPRFADLIGLSAELPLVGRSIPIIADEHAQIDKGTGCVKITPAHDFNDYEVGQRHRLPIIRVLDEDAKIMRKAECLNADGSDNDTIRAKLPEKYIDLDRFEARSQIISDLKELGLLDSVHLNDMTVPYGDRSGVIIEPMLTNQWFVNARELAGPALNAVETGRIKFVPEQYKNMYYSWLKDIQDWCISRQLWWGHRIPAWYDENGIVYVGTSDDEIRKKYRLGDTILRRDPDVLDTWFSSALWSFSTLGWPEANSRLSTFHPTSVLVTGFDIIFFWVARMIMLSMQLLRDKNKIPQIPFKTVYVHGLIRDEQGQKMSKSKGNVLDPLDMVDGISKEDLQKKRTSNMMQAKLAEEIANRTAKQFPNGIPNHGTDAVRFTLCALASQGRDINWDMRRLGGYRNFCNKLWNASRFVLLNTKDQDFGNNQHDDQLSLADRWIRSRLQTTINDVLKHLQQYRFDLAAQSIYDFVWNEYCDWFIELSKPILWDAKSSDVKKICTRRTLTLTLETTLRLAHPMIPYITEEIWQYISPIADIHGNTIMLQPYPISSSKFMDAEAETKINWVKSLVTAIRTVRAEMGISPGIHLNVMLDKGTDGDYKLLEETYQLLIKLGRLKTIKWVDQRVGTPPAIAVLAGGLEILVLMESNANITDELNRLEKEMRKIDAQCRVLEAKLSNPGFSNKAPKEVVEKERKRLQEYRTSHTRLSLRKSKIRSTQTPPIIGK